jgi:hypothetical protein
MTLGTDPKAATRGEFLAGALSKTYHWAGRYKGLMAAASGRRGWKISPHASVPLEPKALAVTNGRMLYTWPEQLITIFDHVDTRSDQGVGEES